MNPEIPLELEKSHQSISVSEFTIWHFSNYLSFLCQQFGLGIGSHSKVLKDPPHCLHKIMVDHLNYPGKIKSELLKCHGKLMTHLLICLGEKINDLLFSFEVPEMCQ